MTGHDTPSRAMNAVMNKDRAGWLSCFTENARVRDPVGGSPLDPEGKGLVGKEALGQFWDLMVSPAGAVRFDVKEEYISGRSVARVGTVRIEREPEAAITYGGVFIYDLDVSGRIEHLHGYFQMPVG